MAYTRVNWQDLPNQTTPATATNLNKMDAGIKENDDRLNGTKSIDNTIYANDFKCRNMLNKNIWLGGYYTNEGTFYPENTNSTFDYIEVKPNTTYTVSTSSNVLYLGMYEFDSDLNLISSDFGTNVNTYTLTTSANTQYVRPIINYDNVTVMTQSIIDGLTPQLELGSQATPYIPHKDFEKEEIYSTTETVVGTWHDGKTLYRQTVPFTTGSADTITSIVTLQDGDIIKLFDGYISIASADVPLNFYFNNSNRSATYPEGKYLNCLVGSDYANKNGIAIVEYTKNN